MDQEIYMELDSGEDGLKVDNKSEKADSGMDEDSQPYKGNEDDKEEDIIVCKSKSKRAVIDDDDDDEDSMNSSIRGNHDSDHGDKHTFKTPVLRAKDVLDAVLNNESDHNNSSSSDGEDDVTLLSTIKKKKAAKDSRGLESEDEDSTDTKNVRSHLASQAIFSNSDLFDAEEENSRQSRDSGEETASDSNNEGAEDDEGFDEANIDPTLLKKLKKGASKKASRSKKHVEQEGKLKLHSETQRIVRESRVNLPYHQPEPKRLQDFLARANSKQQQYSALRGARDSMKAKVLEEMMTRAKLKEKQCDKSPLTSNDEGLISKHVNSDETIEMDNNSERIDSDNDDLPELTSDHVTDDSWQRTEDKINVTENEENSMEERQDSVIENLNGSQKNVKNNEIGCEQTSNVESQNSFQDSLANKENKNGITNKDLEKSKLLSKKLTILSELPKLNVGCGNVIDLEVNCVQSKKPGVNKLMDRFMEHSKKKPKYVPKDLELSVVQKEKNEEEKDELKLNTFVYHVTEEEASMSQYDTPGAKLVALKERLKQKMKVKREENRKQRQEVFDLDNEEGYVEEDKVLDDDDEMTDKSDTDVEDDDFDEQFDDEEEVIEEEKEENPFYDNEAEENDDEDEDEFRLHLTDSDNNGDNEDSDDGVEDDDDIIKKKQASSTKKKAKRLEISDDEESRLSSINKQGDGEGESKDHIEDMGEEHFSPFSKHLTDITQLKKTPSLDSNTQSVNFYIEESQMLDADGFLKVGSDRKSHEQKTMSPNLKNFWPTQDQGNMDELLGLCSGRFTDEDEKKTSCKNLFGMNTAPESTQGNMDELLGLCSGKFVSNTLSGQKRKAEFDDDSLQMVSDVEDDDFESKEKDTFSDEDDNETNSVQSETKSQVFKGFVSGKTGKIRKEFVDEEAELSGSEYDSDENLDLAEEDDIMMEELGDNDVTATEDELRNQVGRAHLKQMIDEDKRELMRFQEMYLPDGDLHSDAGRTRRFKWSNIDDDTQQDMFDKSDDEKEEDEGEEAQWRKDRFEREKWLQEQQECEKEKADEDSQFLKLGKVFLKRQDSDSVLLKKPEEVPSKPAQKSILPAPKLSRRGSFLSRDKDTLAKIANMSKSKSAVNPSGARSSGKFVFQVISPDKDSQVMPAPSEPKMKKTTCKQPPSKKPRLERSASFSQSSIFNHL